GVDVGTLKFGDRLAAVDGSAGDRFADVVMVLPDRFDQVVADVDALAAERVERFAEVPAVVATIRDEDDFLVEVLADFAAPEDAGPGIEGNSPDVAKSVGEDF